MIINSGNSLKSCYFCHTDPPIMKFVNFNSKTTRNANLLIGCSSDHITPYIIKPGINGIIIERDKSKLQPIELFEKDYKEIVDFFKITKEFQGTYQSIIKSIISRDQKGAMIHFRYFVEIHEKIKLFSLIQDPEKDPEIEWSDLKGSKICSSLTDKNRSKTKWYDSLSEEQKIFLKNIDPSILQLRTIYRELSEQLHYFSKNKGNYKNISKSEWTIGVIIDKFKDFLNIAAKIENPAPQGITLNEEEIGDKQLDGEKL